MARSLLKARSVPARFWGEAVVTAVYLLNRAPTKSLDGQTPYEAWHGVKPAVDHLRTFGCVAHVKNVKPHLSKLEDRSKKVVLLGYEPGAKAYRVFDPVARRIHISRDIVFDEDASWDWEEEGDGDGAPGFVVSDVWTGGEEHEAAPTSTVPATTPAPASTATSAGTTTSPASPSTPSPTLAGAPMTPIDGAALESGIQDSGNLDRGNLDADHDSSCPLRLRGINHILGDADASGQAARELDFDQLLLADELCLHGGEEPATFAEAELDVAWQRAMLEEMAAIERNGTWRLATLPSGHRPIRLKWVYKLKKDADGNVIKHKARLVAKGYVQKKGVDFDDAFAPVARLESVRMLLAIAAQEGWTVHHMDVKSAFLNGDLSEEVYVVQPPGFVKEGEEEKVLRLDKALYGLRQAPRAWNIKLDRSLCRIGFRQSNSEHGVYARGAGAKRLLVGVYVDDLIITGGETKEIDNFKKEMTRLFLMSDLGPLSFYLGIEVKQSSSGITLNQSAYAARIVEKAGLTGCNPVHIPMEPRFKLSKNSTAPETDATEHRSLVGCLRYLVNTRPDLAYAVGYVSRFMEKPTSEHLAAVKRLLRYVAGTINYGCRYVRQGGEAALVGYSDSDMAGDLDTRKSTSGVLFFLGQNAVSWQSQKQRVVALSSCEAEYIAAATAACQGVWLAKMLGELRKEDARTFELRIDNQSAIALIKNPVFHERSKHIETRYHYIRECAEARKLKVEFIGTGGQLADILTKPLARNKFVEQRLKLGVVEVK
ncbi:unnamed protein product [Urochloa humidicola]